MRSFSATTYLKTLFEKSMNQIFHFPYSMFYVPKRCVFFVFCVLCLGSSSAFAGIAGSVREGNKLYVQGEYQDALQKYNQALQKKKESDIINFNAGTAAYKMGEHEQSQGYFQKALLSEDSELKQKAHYNLGNVLYRSAEGVGLKNPQAAVPFLEKSLAQYEQALEIDSKDEDVKFNYDFVKKVLEKVKEQIEKQKQQCNNPEKSEEGKQKQEQEGEERKAKNEEKRQEEQEGEERKAKSEEEKNASEPRNSRTQEKDFIGKEDRGAGEQRDDQNLSEREAQMRLSDYKNNEEPEGMLNLRGKFDTRVVEKDW